MASNSNILTYGGSDIVAGIVSRFAGKVVDDTTNLNEASIIVAVDALPDVAKFLRSNSQCLFSCLMDICGVDYPEREKRFNVVYHLLSIDHNIRLRMKVEADANTIVPSMTQHWIAAGWFERECWDMYGVMFSGHPDLRRILTDYGFEGYPLRKDFPLTGFTQVRYDDELRRVVHEPVSLDQEYRNFDFTSPWEAVSQPAHNPMLKGDEKASR